MKVSTGSSAASPEGLCFILVYLFLVEDMIKEVDVDGDGRIDFYGKDAVLFIKFTYLTHVLNRCSWVTRESLPSAFSGHHPECLPCYSIQF